MFAFSPAFAVRAVVDRVLDGDTFAAKVLLEDDTQITVRVRVLGVDTPEINGLCQYEKDTALLAKNRTAQLLPVGSVVELSEIKDDKYLGRIDARVKTSDGKDLAEILIKEKLGRPYDGGRRATWCGNK
ncbi:MAG TPA: thermonuclease family protein [Candidatus Enterousia avicola]|uniref:Thermonuclease family protein n=1 Tax=Candidatus Enterousia avicola TaxID=2840787 RepID=A0A9D1SMJ9_9PROT|nr:thermonuclease family protein [Candidatus Enterousia avicola]